MSTPKRREPSRLMASMSSRVEATRTTLLNADSSFAHSFELDMDVVDRDPDQARKIFDVESIESLAGSLKTQGQLQPVLVRRHPEKRGHWMIVAGERRWQAARKIGWKFILAIEYSGEHEVASLVENLQRVDLNVVEEARAVKRLIDLNRWSQRVAGQALGRSASDINGLLRLLELPDGFLSSVLNSEHPVSRNLLIELGRVPHGQNRDNLLARAKAGSLTIADIRQTTSDLKAQNPPAHELTRRAMMTSDPGLGGKRRLDGKAISRFYHAFITTEAEAFSEEDRKALVHFANAVIETFGPL